MAGHRERGSGGALVRLLGSGTDTDELRAAGNRVLRRSLGEIRGAAAALIAVNLLGLVATVLMPAVLASAVDAVVSRSDLTRPWSCLALLLVLTTVADASDDLIASRVGARMTAGLRHRLLRRTLAFGVPQRQPFPAAEVLSRLAVNADSPATFLPIVLSAGTTVLAALGGVAGLALIDWRLAATFLLGVPVAVALVRAFLSRAGRPFARYQQVQARLVGRLLDAFVGIRTIRACGTLDREIERILQPLPELHAAGRQVWMLQGRATWRLMLLTPTLQVLVLSVGGWALAEGRISPGQLVAAASYVAMALGAVGLADALVSLLSCQIGAGRVGQVLDAAPAVTEVPDPLPTPLGPGRLDLRGVTVLDRGRIVLDAVDLSVPAGASVAVVGRSGAGKSTLVALVGRLLDPDRGDVLLDGVPVRLLALPALRRTVTYAFERPAPLGTTVHEMISYGRPEADRAEVVRAARAARADTFVRMLPDGYDTPLARTPMSGGELQRLGLARAILTRARVVVLDDATSSLDTATEVEVTRALDETLAGRTCLVVAHRAATAARADLVVWLDGGRIRATAPHPELRSDPCYRALFAPPDTGSRDPGSCDAGSYGDGDGDGGGGDGDGDGGGGDGGGGGEGGGGVRGADVRDGEAVGVPRTGPEPAGVPR